MVKDETQYDKFDRAFAEYFEGVESVDLFGKEIPEEWLRKEIEKNLNTTIRKIFETKGEEYFRKIEEKTTLKKLKLNSTVVSLGGGAFANKNIRNEVLKNHYSFWLNWNEKILVERIKNSKKRPLTINATDNDLIDLIKKRTNIYSKALYEIKCDNLTKNEIVSKIKEIYETN